ncbi:MAG: hypothetical protein ACK5MT_17345 [Actinomycetales bacterium]
MLQMTGHLLNPTLGRVGIRSGQDDNTIDVTAFQGDGDAGFGDELLDVVGPCQLVQRL